MGGFLGEVAKKAGVQKRAAEGLGLQGPSTPRTPPVSVPPADAQRPEPTQRGQPQGPVGRSLGPIPDELRSSLARILDRRRQQLSTEQTRQFGRGDDRNQFFNLHGRTPTQKELSTFNLNRGLERSLGRPATVSELRGALRNAEFIDHSPESF